MKKFKLKYKWSKRESHFAELNAIKRLRELYGRTWEFGLRGQQMRTADENCNRSNDIYKW